MTVSITRKQLIWLMTKGDRDIDDLVMYNSKIGILLYTKDKDYEFSELPDDRYLKKSFLNNYKQLGLKKATIQ